MQRRHGLLDQLLAIPWRHISNPYINFVSIHYTYFILLPLIFSVIFWASSEPKTSISYVDSLFLVVSAITESGLGTVNLSTLTTLQQIMLWILILFGGAIWVSIWLIAARRRSFRHLVEAGLSGDVTGTEKPGPSPHQAETRQRANSGRDAMCIQSAVNGFEITGSNSIWPRRRSVTKHSSPGTALPLRGIFPSRDEFANVDHEVNSLSFLTNKTVGRNGHFFNLTDEEKRRVNRIEYEALKILSVVVPLYFILWQLLCCIGLGAWIANNLPGPAVANGVNPWWLGIFNGVSAFNNSGMSLLDQNMVPYQRSFYVLGTMGLMILAGNTAYPVLLRLIFWVGLKLLRALPPSHNCIKWTLTVEYILKYPRRVYTHMFSARHTWWLAFMVLLLNSIDWAAFDLLNIGNPVVSEIPPASRRLDGLFQAIAVRSGGFYVVPIAQVHIGLQVLYVIMMYISAFPVIITMRHSNVYEEHAMAMYAMNTQDSGNEESQTLRSFAKRDESRSVFISEQIRGQLAHDIWLLALAVFIITVIEANNFVADPVSYSVFNIIFEVVSAYGCVGISVGLPNQDYSFCGGWHSASKLVLCVVMLRGRHRGLPSTMDHAVRLAGKHLHEGAGEGDGQQPSRHSC